METGSEGRTPTQEEFFRVARASGRLKSVTSFENKGSWAIWFAKSNTRTLGGGFEKWLYDSNCLKTVQEGNLEDGLWHMTYAILRGTEPVSAPTRSFLYCCALNNFSLLGFRQQWSRADRVINLNTTIQNPLFWRTWTRPSEFHCLGELEASTSPHVQAWHMGRDYSYCRASELTDLQVSGIFFFWFLKNTEKTKAS